MYNSDQTFGGISILLIVDFIQLQITTGRDLWSVMYGTVSGNNGTACDLFQQFCVKELTVNIQTSVREIPQEVGVRQEDNMAPVLFLFLMTAFAETMELKWKHEKIKVVTAMIAANDEIKKGQLCSHMPKMFHSKILSAYKIFQCLYVEDGAFPFNTRKSLSRGMTLVHRHFTRFGLEMQIGRNGSKSKMECVFFPPAQFFQQCQLPTIGDNQCQTQSMTTRTSTDAPQPSCLAVALPDNNGDDEEKTECKGAIYDKLDKTKEIAVKDGYVTFTGSFRYLDISGP
jgi:hypothetical protein